MNKGKIPFKDQYKMYLINLAINDIEETYELKTMSYFEFIKSNLCVKNIEVNRKMW
jgi:ribosomal protein L20